MKKAKIILIAIAVLGAVGAGLTFSAKKAAYTFYCKNPMMPEMCNQKMTTYFTIDPNGTTTVSCSIIPTINEGNNCIIRVTPVN